jgi:hypothetical protein
MNSKTMRAPAEYVCSSSLKPPASSLQPPASSLARGLTLFEMLLVLTLLVILGALSMPALDGAMANSRVRHGGDEVRAAWATARLNAMQTGQTHVFRCVWGSGQYHIEALDMLVPAVEGELEQLPDVAVLTDADVADDDWVENRITGGVRFANGQWTDAFGQIDTDLLRGVQPEGQWSMPIYFFADGTTSDATLVIENDRGDRVRLTLRGLTGLSLAADAGLDEEL